MKNAWRNTRKLRDQSGSGVRREDNASTFDTLLETKCPLFWRLDGIWGSRQNINPVLSLNSIRVKPGNTATNLPDRINPQLKSLDLEPELEKVDDIAPESPQHEFDNDDGEWEEIARSCKTPNSPSPIAITEGSCISQHNSINSVEESRISKT